MIQDEKPRSGYQERLLSELRALAERNAAGTPPEPERRRGLAARPKLALAGIAGGACVASAAIAFTGGNGGGATAYAVEPHDDGSVTVAISRLEDAAGLERQLRAAGVPAEVDFLPLGYTCREPRFEPATGGRAVSGLSVPVTIGAVTTDGTDGMPATFTLQKGDVGPGQTLVIVNSQGTRPGADPSERRTSIALAIAQGDVAPCDPVRGSMPDPEPVEPKAEGAPAPRLDESGTGAGGSDEPGTTERED